MVFFNWATMQMAAKIVYYGPGLCGKTSNLSYIYAKTSPTSRGEMVSLETESDRTLFFDLLPIEVGTIGGFKTRLQLYTVPGQVFYNTTRKLVLKGVDGIVFVADSQRPMREANLESFQSLRENLAELSLSVDELPLVLQFNKRDLATVLTVDELNEDLNPQGAFPHFEASAINGDGVFETLKEITKLTLKKLRRRMAAPQATAGRPRPSAPAIRPTPTPPAAPVQASIPPGPAIAPPATPVRRSSISAAALARAAEEGVDESRVEVHDHGPLAPCVPTEARSSAVPSEWPPPPPVAVEPDTPALVHAEPPPEVSELEFEAAELEPPTARPPEEHTGALQWPPPPDAAAFDASEGPEPQLEASGEAFELDNGNGDRAPDLETGPPESAPPEPFEPPPEPAPLDADVTEPEPGPAPEQEPLAPADAADEPPPISESDSDVDVKVEFDHTGVNLEQLAAPPPLKRVQVSNQMDILAELDGLRKQATMESYGRRSAAPRATDLDLDALLGGGGDRQVRELRRRIEKSINSDIFQRMHGLQIAVRIQDKSGETIHTLDPFSMIIDEASGLKRLSLQFTVDLENLK